jgi:hypothetical protein
MRVEPHVLLVALTVLALDQFVFAQAGTYTQRIPFLPWRNNAAAILAREYIVLILLAWPRSRTSISWRIVSVMTMVRGSSSHLKLSSAGTGQALRRGVDSGVIEETARLAESYTPIPLKHLVPL